MRVKDVKEVILEMLRPVAEENGFKIKKSDFSLIKRIKQKDGGYNTFRIFFPNLHWPDEVRIEPFVSIEFDKIHRICEAVGFRLNFTAYINLLVLQKIKTDGFTPTLAWDMQHEEKDFIAFIDGDDINEKAREILPLVPLALEYLGTNDNMEAISRLYNTLPIEKRNPNCSSGGFLAFLGLISAKLTHAENYDELCEIYSKIVRETDFPENFKESFFKLVDYLKDYPA